MSKNGNGYLNKYEKNRWQNQRLRRNKMWSFNKSSEVVTHRLLIEGVISKNLKREAILDGLKASLKREKEWNYETKPEGNSNKNSIKWQHIQTYLKSFKKMRAKISINPRYSGSRETRGYIDGRYNGLEARMINKEDWVPIFFGQ